MRWRTRSGSVRRAALVACALAALLSALLAPRASATLAYVTGGFPTTTGQPPPAPERVWVARDDGSGARMLTSGLAPVVSPDGRLVAYQRFIAGHQQLVVVSARGGSRARVFVRSPGILAMAWSPTSRTLLASVGLSAGTKRLLLIDVASGRVLRTIATGREIAGFGFSPHGTLVVVALGDRLFHTDLYVASVYGGRLRRLTRDGHSSEPVWGPRWIAFARSRPAPEPRDIPKLDVYLLDPSGRHLRRLTRTQAGGYLEAGLWPLAFSADGLRLLAAYGGQDLLYAETISVRIGVRRGIGTRAQGLVGWALSRDGASVLATTGGPDPGDSDVVAIPWRGGPLRMLARHARMPSWNARHGVT